MTRDNPELLTVQDMVELVEDAPVTSDKEWKALVEKLQRKLLVVNGPRAVVLGVEQFRFILGRMECLERLEEQTDRARNYWQQWATTEIRNAIRSTDSEELVSALEIIRDDFDHEDQTHDHQPFKYGGVCRVCLATRVLEPVLGGPKKKDGVRTPRR